MHCHVITLLWWIPELRQRIKMKKFLIIMNKILKTVCYFSSVIFFKKNMFDAVKLDMFPT